jgi:hypothetical protein
MKFWILDFGFWIGAADPAHSASRSEAGMGGRG